jgi:hypothetical protein
MDDWKVERMVSILVFEKAAKKAKSEVDMTEKHSGGYWVDMMEIEKAELTVAPLVDTLDSGLVVQKDY